MTTNQARAALETNEKENGYVSTMDIPYDRKSSYHKLGTDAWGIYFAAGRGFAGLFITYTDGSGTQWHSADEFNSYSEALDYAARYGY